MFRHRIGPYPTLEMILKSLPTLQHDKIPQDGKRNPVLGRTEERKAVSEDTDAILMDWKGQMMLQELFNFRSIGFPKNCSRPIRINGDIHTTWNPLERRGEMVVRIYLCRANVSNCLTRLLGIWFGVLPFPLSSLMGRAMQASEDVEFNHCWGQNFFPVPPFTFSRQQLIDQFQPHKEEMLAAAQSFNEKNQHAAETKFPLQSSRGKKSPLGLLQRYFAEVLPEDVVKQLEQKPSISWAGRSLGIVAHHRNMKYSQDRYFMQQRDKSHVELPGSDGMERPKPLIESYVAPKDLFLCESIRRKCAEIYAKTQSMEGMLMHLENLGHGEAPLVEGLNIELLPFQRQSLQWALERETVPGGVQRFWWAKLPVVEDPKAQDTYYCPILDRISTKPKLVRGGIIADEMGLGKTVVSLGLVLQNQAPLVPESGTKSTELKKYLPAGTSVVGWDPDYESKGSAGSILSRGTLVICHVSLVGQWITEARSKLKDPGLVYAYHGGNRTRNPIRLAKNSIVVTTYATLGSDKHYKGYHQYRDDYCPPCEQVRWWRIICDESHTLRSNSGQRDAIYDLVGDHRWAVSGTPWNTSLNDVKGQLIFVGLEHLNEMFEIFNDTVAEHVTSVHKRNYRSVPKADQSRFGCFTFLMRAIMIRHSQKQTYRGTETTLMSLPPKSERVMEIDFTGADAAEYATLEKCALDFYEAFRNKNEGRLSSHYLLLMQKLTPMRVACAGGRIPIYDETGNDDNKENDRGRPKTKESGFSDYVFQSKTIVLINELKRIRDEDPSSKSLIFSQYTSSLQFLQEELPRHGFQFRTLSGDMTLKQRADALNKFQHDPPTTIFLLSMRAGAMGINLTQANRVFLLEPAMNPALEAQALGRVYRLGQTRPVEVVRLMMKASVETRMRKFLEKKYGISYKDTPVQDGGGDDSKPAAASSSTDTTSNTGKIVGCLRTDRAAIIEDEFDVLFGAKTKPFTFYSSEGPVTFMPDEIGSDNIDINPGESGFI